MSEIPFWINDPYILLQQKYIFDLWPTTKMGYEQKLNAISRIVIILSIFGFVFTHSFKFIFAGIVTLILLVFLYKLKKKHDFEGFLSKKKRKNELPATTTITNPETLEKVLQSNYHNGEKKNPFNNVLLSEISETPHRKSAPPSFNPSVEENITKNVKKSVQFMNPKILNTNKQLFSSLWDNFLLDQSNRVFYSTANTRIEPGDQAALGKYLYGNMPSAKESTIEGAIARVQDSYRYTLY